MTTISKKPEEYLFHNTTHGELTLEDVLGHIRTFIRSDRDYQYHLIVGSDSQMKNKGCTDFVTAIIVHRVGAGGIYFWRRSGDQKKRALKERIFEEATLSLVTAHELAGLFKTNGLSALNIEIHVDVGTKGPTRVLIQEVVGMIRGSGFPVKTKPEAFGASSVADRHT